MRRTKTRRMQHLRRQVPFLKSLLSQAKKKGRDMLLRYANKDQINAVSDVVLNALKRHFLVTPDVVARARPYKTALRHLANRKRSVKQHQNLLVRQKGAVFWKSFNGLCCCLCR